MQKKRCLRVEMASFAGGGLTRLARCFVSSGNNSDTSLVASPSEEAAAPVEA